MQSLVSNSIEYTPEGGSIKIKVWQEGDKFVIETQDTGIGIPKEAQATILEKFSRAENAKLVKTDGTGLGMFIAKQAVDLMKGKIEVTSPVPGRENDENPGTMFNVTLPMKCEAVEGDKRLA